MQLGMRYAPLSATRESSMPSEKAKENKALVARCAACDKTQSTELMQAVVVRQNGLRTSVPVCDPCIEKGWRPPDSAN